MRIPVDRRLPLSPRGKKVLVEASKEMRRLEDNFLGTEHVLLRISCNKDGTAVRILASTGVSPEMLEDRLYQLHG